MSAAEWQHVGDVLIDSGCLVVIDPAGAGDMFAEGVDKLFDQLHCERGTAHAPLVNMFGVSAGVVVTAGYGDGRYPVEVQKDPSGRIRVLRVTFIPHPVLGDLDAEPGDPGPALEG